MVESSIWKGRREVIHPRVVIDHDYSNDVEAIFQPVLQKISELVADQRLKVKQAENETKV
jgi:hypothetical protein